MKNNLLGNALLVVIACLLIIGAVQMLGLGSGINAVSPDEVSESAIPNVSQVSEVGVSNQDSDVDSMLQSPLLSATRKPFVPPEDVEGVTEDGSVEEGPAEPLQAKIVGIAITPEQSYVMVHDSLLNKNFTLKPGMPLEGEQGAWYVEEIMPRKVLFSADGQEPQELELEVHSQSLKSLAKTAKKKQRKNNRRNTTKNRDNDAQTQRKNSAEEIRKKIAERRAQMRADAAKKKE